jgi:hypothetical protein
LLFGVLSFFLSIVEPAESSSLFKGSFFVLGRLNIFLLGLLECLLFVVEPSERECILGGCLSTLSSVDGLVLESRCLSLQIIEPAKSSNFFPNFLVFLLGFLFFFVIFLEREVLFPGCPVGAIFEVEFARASFNDLDPARAGFFL